MARYLVLKGYSGLGNRLGALAQALAYSRLTERQLIVDWSDYRYSSDGTDVFHQLFDCPLAGPIDRLPRAPASITPPAWRKRLADPTERQVRSYRRWHFWRRAWTRDAPDDLSVDITRLDHPEEVAVLFDFRFQFDKLRAHAAAFPSAWEGLSSDALAAHLIRTHAPPHPAIAAAVADFKRTHFTSPTVGVHLRQSDNLVGAMAEKKGIDLPRLEAALARAGDERPGARLFVATDNRATLDRLRARYPTLVTREKWYPAPGEALHGHPRCPDKLAMARDALTDLLLLAECDHLVYSSRASFARWARLLSPLPGQTATNIEAAS